MKIFVMSLLLVFAATGALAITSDPLPPAGGPAISAPPAMEQPETAGKVSGTVMRIDPNNYIIRDSMGNEMRLLVDEGTTIMGEPMVGDLIQAELTAGQKATSIKKIGS